ncbi:putative 54S ribosomal protein L17, mitochondrial [Tirmania nivea]|nr:putative 54S ribosomal protein L17, mitochondrial [Tirmania nivea]
MAEEQPAIIDFAVHPVTQSSSLYKLASSVVLSRPPVLTRDIPDFENAYYFYQRRLNERLALPFTRYFFFKKKSIAEAEYKKRQARITDKYNPYKEGWKDELMVGDYRWKKEDFGYQEFMETTVSGDEVSETLEGDVAGEVKKSVNRPMPRTTEADLKNDTKSLDRKLSRTLYLLVKKPQKGHAWKFPQADLIGQENLKEAAMRALEESCGVNMNTWFVGNVPIGHYRYKFPSRAFTPTEDETKYLGKKVFFMKARIMAGQANLENNKRGLVDFQWLTREEIEKTTTQDYWHAMKDLLVTQ